MMILQTHIEPKGVRRPKSQKVLMKAKIVSDQHLEFRSAGELNGLDQMYFDAIHPRKPDGSDLCIVAGDFIVGRRSQEMFKELCDREPQVLYVPGNHEYYGCASMAAVDDALRMIEQGLPNLKMLRTGEVFEFAGVRFLGDTMWVPKTAALILSANQISDARLIPGVLGEIGGRYQGFINWLAGELRPGDVVVTHHLPSEQSTPPRYRNSSTQPWFVAFGAESLFAKEPRAWIHGHSHDHCDYVLNKTRVLCNPVGYPGEITKLPGDFGPFMYEL